jgi:excinuclease UvrABC helicase subunit UvrB
MQMVHACYMYVVTRSRKKILVEIWFRLPAAMDNPLKLTIWSITK